MASAGTTYIWSHLSFLKACFCKITPNTRDLEFQPNILTYADTLTWQTCYRKGVKCKFIQPLCNLCIMQDCVFLYKTLGKIILTLKYPQRSHLIKTNWTSKIYSFSPNTIIKSCCCFKKKIEENKSEKDFAFILVYW